MVVNILFFYQKAFIFFTVFMAEVFADAKLYRNRGEKQPVDANELKVL